MREAATLGDIHHLGVGHALQQIAACVFEPQVTESGAGRLAENSRNCRCSVRLERPAASASSVTVQSRPTFVRIASSARRTPRGSKDGLETDWGCIHRRLSSDMTMYTDFGEKFHDRDSSVANWIEGSRPLRLGLWNGD